MFKISSVHQSESIHRQQIALVHIQWRVSLLILLIRSRFLMFAALRSVEVPAYAVRFLSQEIDARVIVLTTILPFLALVALQKILRFIYLFIYLLKLFKHGNHSAVADFQWAVCII